MSELMSLGFDVRQADGEADVFLNGFAAENPSGTILSSDSDLLFHTSVQTWLVPKVKGCTITCTIVDKAKESVYQ